MTFRDVMQFRSIRGATISDDGKVVACVVRPDRLGEVNWHLAQLKKHRAAYEQAVSEAPDWTDAADNLALARYTLDYIEATREAADTGDESELGADGYKFDNTEDRGQEMTITKESTMDLAAEEKWMRAVDTETRDFLRSRFELESDRAAAGQ